MSTDTEPKPKNSNSIEEIDQAFKDIKSQDDSIKTEGLKSIKYYLVAALDNYKKLKNKILDKKKKFERQKWSFFNYVKDGKDINSPKSLM